MKNEIVQAMLIKVMNWTENGEVKLNRPYLQGIAKYKYDNYQQFFPGMRFIERLAIWLNQFESKKEKEIALNFIKNKLVFVSNLELNHLVNTTYPDFIKQELIKIISSKKNLPEFKINKILETLDFKVLKRQSLFLGLSDGAKIDQFRRSNSENLTHEQIYQTYELSTGRIIKMVKSLKSDLKNIVNSNISKDEQKFKILFLIDDFSASGKSCISWNEKEKEFKGKIYSLFKNIKDNEDLSKVIDLSSIKVYIVLYLCTQQAYNHIISFNKKLEEQDFPHVNIITVYKFYEDIKLNLENDFEIIEICNNDNYYDKNSLEDSHTQVGGGDVKLGFDKCSLPLVLYHNTPNNSVSILWAYDNASFKGLFPRIPRHRDL